MVLLRFQKSVQINAKLRTENKVQHLPLHLLTATPWTRFLMRSLFLPCFAYLDSWVGAATPDPIAVNSRTDITTSGRSTTSPVKRACEACVHKICCTCHANNIHACTRLGAGSSRSPARTTFSSQRQGPPFDANSAKLPKQRVLHYTHRPTRVSTSHLWTNNINNAPCSLMSSPASEHADVLHDLPRMDADELDAEELSPDPQVDPTVNAWRPEELVEPPCLANASHV